MRKKQTRAERNIQWVEQFCRIPEGKFVGQPLKLAPFMREDFYEIYDNPSGTRLAILSRGRKNAKTVEAAIITLLHLCGPEARENSDIYSAAQSRDQAGILFDRASKMVRLSPVLSEVVQIGHTGKWLKCPELGTTYKALSAEVSTSLGLSPVLIIHDELGQVKGPVSPLYEALETATAAQDQPLSIVISTQAPTDADLLSVLIDDALGGHDPRVVIRIDSAPLEMDAFGIEAIRLANPAFEYFMNKDEVLAMANAAKRMPSRESQYRNLVLNQRVEASSPFVSRALWKTCGADPKPIEGVPVYGGLDLSSVNDLTGLVLIGEIEGIWQVHPTFWLPGDGLAEKSRADRVPYDQWEKQGYLVAAPGKSVDYQFVAEYIRNIFGILDVRKIAFDRWNFKHLKPWLMAVGFTEKDIEEHFIEFGQGFASMSPALRDLEAEILNGRLAHGNHPVLSMCANNAVVQMDPSGNRKLAKNKSSGRIDGMVALTMAIGAAPAEIPSAEPQYQMIIL